jgi:hypothetical protein
MKLHTLRAATAALILCSTLSVTACASHEETTTTVTPATSDYPATATTTTTTVTDDEHHDSVVGATLHAVGTIVLFPFRLVGDAISLIV